VAGESGGGVVAGEKGGGVVAAQTGSSSGNGQEVGAGVRRSNRKRVVRVREEDARMEELLTLCVCWTEMVARSVYS
jgi:hypothetical protein